MDDSEFDLEQANDFSFILILPKSGRPFKCRIPAAWIYGLFMSFMLVLISTFGYSYYTKHYSVAKSEYENLEQSFQSQQKQVLKFEEKLQDVEKKILELKKQELEIEHLFRPRNKAKKYTPGQISKIIEDSQLQFDQAVKFKDLGTVEGVRSYLAALETEVSRLQKTIGKKARIAVVYESRFASTPSIWPVYGSIRSGHGYRQHPVHGNVRFHKGIDIPSWFGAPVRGTADGIVEYAGWGGGYGWLVILWHNHGYQTVYAHLSEMLVSMGQTVKKGQLIAKVGSSGLSTGPHLHYEVRRWNEAIRPNPYLDLELFTAVNELW